MTDVRAMQSTRASVAGLQNLDFEILYILQQNFSNSPATAMAPH